MDPISKSSTTEGLPVAPSLEPSLEAAHVPRQATRVDRRGIQVLTEYTVDLLAQTLVRHTASYPAVSLKADMTLQQVHAWIASGLPETCHQGFPILDGEGRLIGVLTRRDLFDPNVPMTKPLKELIKRRPAVVFEDHTLREAADLMVGEEIGRLPVVMRSDPSRVVAMLTRSDLLLAHRKRLEEAHQMQQNIRWRKGLSASRSG